MKILMLSWEYPPRIVGGISRVVYYLARELSKQGHEVTIITCREGETLEFEVEDNVKVHRVEPYLVRPLNFINSVLQMNLLMLEEAVRIIQNGESFDMIHLHDWLVAFAGRSLQRLYPIPQVCTMHSTEYGRNAGIHNEIQSYIHDVEKELVSHMKKVIVNSRYMKNEIHALFGCCNEDIHVIPNGMELDKFSGVMKDMVFRRKYAEDKEKIVFFVGRLVNEKGVHILMEAIPRILSVCGDVRFVISGSGPERDTLQKRAMEMGVSERVCFTGYVQDEELDLMYKCIDILVFPSLYEPFGIVALEGMVARVPVVVSEAGGLNEIVTNRYNGMKFSTGRSDLLAECILELLFNDGLVKDITKNAWNTIHEKYLWKDIAEAACEVYEEIIKRCEPRNARNQ